MIAIKTLLQWLVAHGKTLSKSATMWLSAFMMALPDMLTYVQANWPTIAGYLPHAWQDRSMFWIGVAIAVCRLRSMVKLPVATALLLGLAIPFVFTASPVEAAEVPVEKDAPKVEGHPLTSIVVTQCNLIVAVYMTMPDGRLLRFDKSASVPSSELMTMAYSAVRSERVEVSCNEVGAVGYEKHEPV